MSYQTKEALRTEMLKKRGALDRDFIRRAGSRALDLLRELKVFDSARTVMLYMDCRNEFPTDPILSELSLLGKSAVLPLTGPDFRITPYTLWEETPAGSLAGEKKEDSFESPVIASFRSLLCPSPMGIPEPDPRNCRQTRPAEIDLVIVPGVVFDRAGRRIGFGKACYDRFLPLLRTDVPKIGLAYEFQVLPQIPSEPTDIPMDFIVTEAAVYSAR